MRTVPIYHVDAFTEQPFAGNPAAVCLLDAPLPDDVMQAIAAEMNLSETAFLQQVPPGEGRSPARYGLRWFTPRAEVRLCGHATLASGAVLFREEGLKSDLVDFDTLSGVLPVRRVPGGIQMDFPADPPAPRALPEAVAEALGVASIVATHRSPSLGMTLVEVQDQETVAALRPDMRALQAVVRDQGMGYIVTAPGTGDVDFVSRFFAPSLGIDEDPVTGSAHTVLAPYWAEKLGKTSLRARQVSERGGTLSLEVLPNGRVTITGQAVVVCKGELRLAS